jgi:hypothetical protein
LTGARIEPHGVAARRRSTSSLSPDAPQSERVPQICHKRVAIGALGRWGGRGDARSRAMVLTAY